LVVEQAATIQWLEAEVVELKRRLAS